MVMSWIWTGMVALSVLCALQNGTPEALAAATAQGAQAGITLAVSMAGSLCLWTGVGHLLEYAGVTGFLSRLLKPVLRRLFPSSAEDPQLAGSLSGNICANFLGLGNAATPMGIAAAKRLAAKEKTDVASHQLCRLIVLNTASIQLIPATVAALRSSMGSASPFDILPAVWLTSLCSAGAGLISAYFLGKAWPDA
jgi:spore maturation protein A